ncbi:MAG: methylglyoxal synthase [Clostridia bacterium]|nr:methylglyoxal synthase [Clostridia bacterium]
MQKKRVALIAHDSKKAEIVEWCLNNKNILEKFELCGTGTTAKRISEATGLKVKGYLSGPLGGDQQIGALVAEGKIDFVLFLCDPLTAQPHDPDVKALLRIANVYNVAIATNVATADLIIKKDMI